MSRIKKESVLFFEKKRRPPGGNQKTFASPLSSPIDGEDLNLTQALLQSLGRAIVTGTFDKRSFPTEAELATRYGVSRSVVREAVKMLAAHGLVSARPRAGTAIQPSASWNLFAPDVLNWLLERRFSLSLLRQFTELRLAVEPAAAALAAHAATGEQLSCIKAAYHRMERAERGEDDVLSADIGFHTSLLNATGNPFFAQLRDIVDVALRSSIRFTNRFKGRTASLADHHAVLAAIESHDPDAAREAMSTLISAVLVLIDTARGNG